MGISLAIITYNEAENLKRLLAQVSPIVDEIVIVDSFSIDNTREIALQFPKVKFSEYVFEGYGLQKNRALEQCTQDWVLFLDADEVPDARLLTSIQEILKQGDTEYSVYQCTFNNFIGNKQIKYGGWGNVKRERLFKRLSAKYTDDKVHEKLMSQGKIGELKGKLNHYTYKSIQHHVAKMNQYSEMMAEEKYRKGKKANLIKVIFSPVFEFVKTYFFRLGFLDGIYGLYIARTMANYTFLKYMKLYEKHQIGS
ncbi:glycosyltransferase family 2 protein [Elizabethkingia sp. JS20170427COW]|uniref:glycosyltransferase family 2 protein n=1 Tax=Elizabethkingia sp. JS20170427COW TaxID=2583851 RepID=UPI001110445A|nr:glycosyltransferase family 2 protein [Elizabethkingia sp. JS20170427COW]QCX53336.1 glycosyltransferase family 2 protein [Elizabethkingia sp. JS20170427COW]